MKPKNHPELTAERLRELLNYDPDTGVFLWKSRSSKRIKIGGLAGCIAPTGYRFISIDYHLYLAHRLAWLYVHGVWPAEQIDHINGVRDDNRMGNLRKATHAENQQNLALRRDNKSGHPGVFWVSERGKWHARIKRDQRDIYLGAFDNIEDAISARKVAKAKIHQFQPIVRGEA